MTPPARDHAYLDQVAPDQLAALVFELASQVEVERQRRTALERILENAGLLPAGAIDASPVDAGALDRALRSLLRILTETGGRRRPLREQHRARPGPAGPHS